MNLLYKLFNSPVASKVTYLGTVTYTSGRHLDYYKYEAVYRNRLDIYGWCLGCLLCGVLLLIIAYALKDNRCN